VEPLLQTAHGGHRHYAADVQGGLLQGAEEESLPASYGFMVADANQLVTLEQAQQKRDAVDVLHSHVI